MTKPTKPDVATMQKLRSYKPRQRKMLSVLLRQDDDDKLTRQQIASLALRRRDLNRHQIDELEAMVADWFIYRQKKWRVERMETFKVDHNGERLVQRRRRRWWYVYYISPTIKPMLKAALKPERKSIRRTAQQPRRVMYDSRWAWLMHRLGFRR